MLSLAYVYAIPSRHSVLAIVLMVKSVWFQSYTAVTLTTRSYASWLYKFRVSNDKIIITIPLNNLYQKNITGLLRFALSLVQ